MNTKSKIILFVIVQIFLFNVPNVNAGNKQRTNYNRKKRNQYGIIKSYTITDALTTGIDYDKIVGIQQTFDYRPYSRFSYGGQVNLFFGEPIGDNGFGVNNKTTSIGLRGHYHFYDQRIRQASPFDLYVGLTTGIHLGKGGESMDKVSFLIAPNAGVRYTLVKSWIVFAEISSLSAGIGIGIVL